MPGGASCPTCEDSLPSPPSVRWTNYDSVWVLLLAIVMTLGTLRALTGTTEATRHTPTPSEADASEDEDPQPGFCGSCNDEFRDMETLNKHLMFSSLHNWCLVCLRDFSTEMALAQHQASVVHRSRDFKCPFCMAGFKSPSGVAHHVESGCHGITRHDVTDAVQRSNIAPDISIKRIAGPSSSRTTYRLFATEASFDGKAYKCYLCSKSCKTLASLNVHLNSAAHDDDEFRCPKCKREFTVVSGFVQHLESQCCGLAEPTQIDGFFNGVSDRFSRLLDM